MSEKEALEQLDSLIEAWDLKDADINQTDINAIKFILQKNQKLKEQLKQRDEVIDKIGKIIDTANCRYMTSGKVYVNSFCLSDLYKILNQSKGGNDE